MYYHVYIEYEFGEGAKSKMMDAYVQDIVDLEVIKKQYVSPFVNGSSMIILSGRVIKSGSISIFRVMSSDEKLEQIVSEKNQSSTSGLLLFYTVRDLLRGNDPQLKDITNELIN